MWCDARAAIARWAVAVVAVAAPAFATPGRVATVELDPARSVVHYALGGTVHDVHGTFRLARGTIDLEEATGVAHGDVVVDAGSGESGSVARDRRMKDVVLTTAAHPEIDFRPARIDGALAPDGAFSGTIHGILTLVGVPHEIDAAARGRVSGSDLAAACHFVVPYVAWGLPDPSLLFLQVAKEVAIDVDAVGHLQWREANR